VKRPAFQFYAGDWQRDTSVQACGLAARGLWIEMLCVMHQAEPRGYLVVNNNPPPPGVLARLVGGSPEEVAALISELERNGVFDRTESGVIFSRRMVRDEAERLKAAEYGSMGASAGSRAAENPNASRPGDPRNGGRPRVAPGVRIPGMEPPTSSSSSSASSGDTHHGDSTAANDEEPPIQPPAGGVAPQTAGGSGKAAQRPRRAKRAPSPEEQRVIDAMRAIYEGRTAQSATAAWLGTQAEAAHALVVTDGHAVDDVLRTVKAVEQDPWWGDPVRFSSLRWVRKHWERFQLVQPNLLRPARNGSARPKREERPDPVYEEYT
jgi:hypothetical protein